MTRPTYHQAQVLRNVLAGHSVHTGFETGVRKRDLARALDRRNADIKACEEAGWLDANRRITLPGEAALARYDRGAA